MTSHLSIGIRPLHDRIIVLPAIQKDRTDSGLFIPENAKADQMMGTVVAVGNGRITEEGDVIALDVKYGDNVIYVQGVGDKLEKDGKKYLIMREDSVVAILTD